MTDENKTKIQTAVGPLDAESPTESPTGVPALSYGAFPPACIEDIMSYDGDDVMEGYRDWRPDDPVPGDNRSPGYRWGWTNGRRDRTGEPDEFIPLRFAYIRAMKYVA